MAWRVRERPRIAGNVPLTRQRAGLMMKSLSKREHLLSRPFGPPTVRPRIRHLFMEYASDGQGELANTTKKRVEDLIVASFSEKDVTAL